MGRNFLTDFFGVNDGDEYDNYAAENKSKQPVNINPNKVLSMTEKRMPDSKINIMQPRIYGDAKVVAKKVMNGSAVIVKLGNVNVDLANRIMDYLDGALFAVDGNKQQIAEAVYLVTPKNFDIDGEMKPNYYDGPVKR